MRRLLLNKYYERQHDVEYRRLANVIDKVNFNTGDGKVIQEYADSLKKIHVLSGRKEDFFDRDSLNYWAMVNGLNIPDWKSDYSYYKAMSHDSP